MLGINNPLFCDWNFQLHIITAIYMSFNILLYVFKCKLEIFGEMHAFINSVI